MIMLQFLTKKYFDLYRYFKDLKTRTSIVRIFIQNQYPGISENVSINKLNAGK